MNLLFLLRNQERSMIFFVNSELIHCHFQETIINSLSVIPIQYGIIIFFANLLWIYYESNKSNKDLLSFSRIHCFNFSVITFYLTNSLFKHKSFLKFNIKSLSFPRTHFEFTILWAKLLYLHNFFVISLSFPQILYQLRKNTLDPFFPRIDYIFTIIFANSLLFSRFTMDPFSFPRIDYIFTIIFANSLLFSRFSMDPFWFPRIDYIFTNIFANSLLFSRFTMDPLFFSRIHFTFTFICTIL